MRKIVKKVNLRTSTARRMAAHPATVVKVHLAIVYQRLA
jgi:hypothetical protein